MMSTRCHKVVLTFIKCSMVNSNSRPFKTTIPRWWGWLGGWMGRWSRTNNKANLNQAELEYCCNWAELGNTLYLLNFVIHGLFLCECSTYYNYSEHFPKNLFIQFTDWQCNQPPKFNKTICVIHVDYIWRMIREGLKKLGLSWAKLSHISGSGSGLDQLM